MTETRVRRALPWKVMGVVAALLVLLLGVPVLWIRSVADRRWAEMEKEVRALHDEWSARDRSRPARAGVVAGSAWDDYDQGVAEIGKAGKAIRDVDEFVGRGAKADREKTLAVVNAHLVALDHLRRGARRERGEYPLHWEEGFSMKYPGLLQSQRLAHLAVARARFLAEEGRAREAMDLMLDTCQLAHDLGSDSLLICEMISIAVYSLAFEEIRDVILSGKLTSDDLLDLERGLETVDRTFPRNGDSLLNERLACGYEFLRIGGGSASLDVSLPAWSAWRYGFSPRLTMADAFSQSVSTMRRAAEADAKPWPVASAVFSQLELEARNSKNPIIRDLIPGLMSSSRAGRERRTQLRLLRVAAHYRATGEVLDLEDPLGARLLHSRSGDHLKVWGIGRNGVDDGGVGGWGPNQPGTGGALPNQDILLEVDR